METSQQTYPLFVGVTVKKDGTRRLEEVKQRELFFFDRGELEAPLTKTGLK